MSFDEVFNQIPEICKNHSGCRIFQKIFEESPSENKQKIIDKIKPEVYNLSKDVFGNYVIQRLLESSISLENKKLLISQLFGKIKELTLHMYGCRVIQKTIDISDQNDVKKFLVELQGDLMKCIQDQNGNHVIQKLIEKLPQGSHRPIINSIKGRVYQLSIHQYGCRVIQRILEFCTLEEKNIILIEIFERINELCLDQYGNYVIQNIVEKTKNNEKIYEGIQGKIYDYSLHKYASNVVEKCLALGTKIQNEKIVNEIIEQDNKNNNIIYNLVKDKFGNYVIQKMIEVAELKSKEILVKKIISSNVLKKRDGFSKHVMGMIEKLGLNRFLENQDNNNTPAYNSGNNVQMFTKK
jgi:pumilio RNA-binding family